MCEVKIFNLYRCPVCKKDYKRKGHYLSAHLQKCGAVAWIPMVKTEISMRKLDEDKLAEAVEKLISGDFLAHIDPIERIKLEAKKDKSKKPLPVFAEYKELMNNGGISLFHVPENELNHIYNIMVN